MWAGPGDRLIIRAHFLGDRQRDAEILEVLGPPEAGGPLRVRWTEDGHESVYYLGSDGWVQHLAEPEPEPAAPAPEAAAPAPRTLGEARVRDWMRTDIISCAPDARVADAAAMMAEHRVHCIAVRPEDGSKGGGWTVLSDLDVAGAAVAEGDVEAVGRFTGTPAVVISPDDTMARAAQLMTEYAAGHLVVAQPGAARPAGILSTLDVSAALARIAGVGGDVAAMRG